MKVNIEIVKNKTINIVYKKQDYTCNNYSNHSTITLIIILLLITNINEVSYYSNCKYNRL